ncbi:MAG: helicase-related protein [Microbacterium sp.]
MSASLGSTQTVQVRVAAATLQAAVDIPEEDRDGYWTNLNFLNSLRELGNTVSLVQSDIPDYLTGLRRRDGIDPRWPHRTMELTSRRRSDEIPKAIEQLQLKYAVGKERQEAFDICLASNIIEVGVDIDRLALMTIVGQPKTTAQYIQVSGRVGRKPEVSPGLVITIYGAAKPRDRSHYERFRTYHQQLYAQVEPTSVTPFAMPVLRRALHAAAVAYVRQTSPETLGPDPFPLSAYDEAVRLLRERAEIAEPDEVPVLDRFARDRARQWGGGSAPSGCKPCSSSVTHCKDSCGSQERCLILTAARRSGTCRQVCGTSMPNAVLRSVRRTCSRTRQRRNLHEHWSDAPSATGDAVRCRCHECARKRDLRHHRGP